MGTISKSGITTAQPIQATHITNIIDALDGTTANNIVFAGPVTASAPISSSAGFIGSLQGTATSANTASWANTITFSNISSLPSSLNGGYSNVAGISSVNLLSGQGYTSSVDLSIGQFNYCDTTALGKDMRILLNTGASAGDECTFFWLTGSFGVQFVTESGVSLVSENNYTKIYTTGSIVTAKFLGSSVSYGNALRPVWVLVGSLKA